MRIAWLNLRYALTERVQIFSEGCKRLGFEPQIGCPRRFDPQDIFITWNRISGADHSARMCEQAGMPVLVAENASWGNEFAGRNWYTIARDYHNVATGFPAEGSERWDNLGITLDSWRPPDGEVVVLPSRGIGPACNRMPSGWQVHRMGRIRAHPGNKHWISLREDLQRCSRVITWGSGAAIKALMWGIKVESHMPNWIGEQDNTDAGRLAMFRRLAWAQWTMQDISSGYAFARLLW